MTISSLGLGFFIHVIIRRDNFLFSFDSRNATLTLVFNLVLGL